MAATGFLSSSLKCTVQGDEKICRILMLLNFYITFYVTEILYHFISLINLSLSQPMSYVTFTLLILSPIPVGEGE